MIRVTEVDFPPRAFAPSPVTQIFGSETMPSGGGPPITGACCFDDGTCTEVTESACSGAGGTYQGDSTTCDPNPCPVLGACCFGDETCELLSADACAEAFGTYQGDNTTCDPNPCLTGACCGATATCSNLIQSDCEGGGGLFFPGVTCDDVSAPKCGCFCYDDLPSTVIGTFHSGGPDVVITLNKLPLSETGGACGYSGTDPETELTLSIGTFTEAFVVGWSASASAPGAGVFWDGDGSAGCENPYGSYGDGRLEIS